MRSTAAVCSVGSSAYLARCMLQRGVTFPSSPMQNKRTVILFYLNLARLALPALLLSAVQGSVVASAQTPQGKVIYRVDTRQLWLFDTVQGKASKVPLEALGPADDRLVAEPCWSPDGRWLVLDTEPHPGSGDRQVYCLKSDGSEARKITSGPGDNIEATVSPDGTQISYRRYGTDKLHIINWDGSNDRDTGVTMVYPRWSADGKRILGRTGGCSDLLAYKVADGTVSQITHAENGTCFGEAEYSPDGQRIVATLNDPQKGKRDIVIMNADGSGLINLTADWTDADQGSVSWSLDGAFLVFTSDYGAQQDIWVMRSDGSGRSRLTNTPEREEGPCRFFQTGIEDDFANGDIDAGLWVWGGAKRGVGGYGSGDWQWSHTESGGALRVRVWGPESGDTYGADAWVRTKHDFNDGRSYLVNFSWEFSANASHLDALAVQITDGLVPKDANFLWMTEETTGSKNLYMKCARSPVGQPLPGQPTTPPTDWSVYIDALAKTAILYGGPNATGTIVGLATLKTDQPWYLRFAIADGTSAGYPVGDNTLSLNYFKAAVMTSTPFISQQPESQLGYWGKEVIFEVGVAGSGSYSYQWLKDGVAILNATSAKLTLHDLKPSDAALYSVVVKGPQGSATSSGARLEVQAAAVDVKMHAGVIINGIVGRVYKIEYSDEVEPATWMSLGNVTLENPVQVYIDFDSPQHQRRFYRVVIP